MKQCLEQGTGVLLCILLPAVGAVTKLVLYGYYTWLEQACQKIRETENRQIQSFRTELRHRKKNGIGVGTGDSYTVFYMRGLKIAGISVASMERIGGYSALMSLIFGGILSAAGVYFGCDGGRVVGLLFLGTAAAAGLLLIDLFFGVEEKKKRICFCMEDYAAYILSKEENSEKKEQVLAFPLTKEESQAETSGKARKEGRAQEEKRRLTEELLKERRQLSARQYIEEVPNTDTEKEPASAAVREDVTEKQDNTEKYEKILRSVLAEFLS